MFSTIIGTKIITVIFALAIINESFSIGIEYKCTNPDEYYHSVPGTRCTSYYKCQADKTVLKHDCLPGTTFDFYKQLCSRSAGICYEPVCAGRINGIYPDTTHACRRSYYCRGGDLSGLDNCPYGYLHNGNTCMPQDVVTCEAPQTTAIAYPYPGDRRCTGLSHGNHVADNTDCKKYIICDAGEVINEIECANGFRYDYRQRQCLPHSQVITCHNTNDYNLCVNLRNGIHSDPTSIDCQSYIKCYGGKFLSREYCSLQAIFNGHQCVPKPLFECPATDNRPALNDLCKRKSNGLWGDYSRGCGGYIRCENGKTVEQKLCQKNQYFDPDHRRCLANLNGNCQVTNSNTVTTVNSGGGGHLFISSSPCQSLQAGFYQDDTPETSCRNYFHCYNGIRLNFRCQTGRVFDGESCVPNKSYECPSQNPNSCSKKSDGYYKDTEGGCRSYFYCTRGQKSSSYLCQENEVFNGTICVAQKSTDLCRKMNVCATKPDGYYYDLTAGCRKYYFCLKFEKVTTLTCHGSKLFNGQKCVTPEQFVCPQRTTMDGGSIYISDEEAAAASQQINCIPRPKCSSKCNSNGFFADIESGCVKYYFCIEMIKSQVLTCELGYVFNGDICVRQELYTCPQYCSNSTAVNSNESC